MFKKPIFWIIFVLLSAGAAFFSFSYFSSAFPLVSLDLTMDRNSSLQLAKELSYEHNWGPEDYREAASFDVDQQAQVFVELEGGGTDVFKQMLTERPYSPYFWSVRHFKENETNETTVLFTPEGDPYGFIEILPEDEPGDSLSADSALVIAETNASEKWGVDFSLFSIVEQSQEVKPSGRIDHKLVYEMLDKKLGEGRYRLRLVVSGDKLTELTYFIKVPEAFTRRYEEMRSANNTIASVAVIALVLFYVVGGCIIGLFFLLKQRYVLWRKPLFWGFFVAFVQVLAGINQWPLAWMSYDTALSAQGFFLQQVAMLLLTFLGMGALLSLSFMAAESLTRKAFPNHVRFWNIWTKDVAASPTVLSQTLSGYLLVSLFMAFDVAIYLFASKYLGWWSPSEGLFEPNILATYFPWLQSIAISLQAGFWEECMFRAIPIAGAALLGNKFGNRKLWIIGAFILQALIFGSGHANYPQQPSYARVVELIIPSIGFGLIYLYWGLLPAIIMHYAVDVVWISLPLFVSSAPGIWIDQLMVIILIFVPLWVVFGSRLRRKAWNALKDEHYNGTWQPPSIVEKKVAEEKPEEFPKISSTTVKILPIVGVLAIIVWIFTDDFNQNAPKMPVSRGEAIELAAKTMENRNIQLPDSWEQLCCITSPLDDDDRFVWQEGGPEAYTALMGSYIAPPIWRVRYVQFEGDVAARAEEYQLYITPDSRVARFRHQLPEARTGASLPEDSARMIAWSVLKEKYNWEPELLKEISATPSKLPERTDWIFTFSDTINYPLEEGDARVTIAIAGDEIVDTYRFIHIPEEWTRDERNKDNISRVVQVLQSLTNVMIFIAGMVAAVYSWSRRRFSAGTFLIFLVLLYGVYLIKAFNSWPCTIFDFSTSEPYTHQMLLLVVLPLVMLLLISFGPSLVLGFIQKWKNKVAPVGGLTTILTGLSVGAIIAGLMAFLSAIFEPSLEPVWAKYSNLGNYLPIIAGGFAPVTAFLMRTIMILFTLTVVDRFTARWTKRKILAGVLLVLIVAVTTGSEVNNLLYWIGSGLLAGIVYLLAYRFVFRYMPAAVPMAIGIFLILEQIKTCVYNAYPSAIPGAILAMPLIGVLAYFWFIRLRKED